jgi:formate/nitrite transporter FocA (FNT family)
MVEYDYFADAGNLVAQHALDFLVVSLSYSHIIGEKFLLGGIVVYSEARVVCGELMLPSSQIVNFASVVLLGKVVAGTIDLGPWLPLVRRSVNVLEACGSHSEWLDS